MANESVGVMWDKTQEEFGYRTPPGGVVKSGVLPVWVRCACGFERTVAWRQFRSKDTDNYVCIKCYANSPVGRAQRSINGKKLDPVKCGIKSREMWLSPKYREKTLSAMNTPEHKLLKSVLSKNMWHDDNIRNKIATTKATPEFSEKMSNIGKAIWKDTDYRNSISSASKNMWRRPEFREKHATSIRTPEVKAKIRATWANQEFRTKMYRIWASSEHLLKMAKARENQSWSMTKPHQNVCDILTGLGIKFEIEKAIGFYSFDVYLPDHKILIEVQGEYWHSLDKAIRRDKAKATYVERYQPDLKLHYIWDYECGQPNKIIEKIKYWCGLTKLELVDYEFKDLTVGPVDKEKANELLTTWHYLDSGRSGIDYGVYLGEQLIAMARWTSIGRQGIASHVGYEAKDVLELARLCVHPRYQKKNLLTWFLSRVEKDIRKNHPDIKCLVSFSDMSQGHTGAVYKAANWEQVSTVSPSYYYIDKDGYVMNKKKLYNYAVKMKVKEAEYADSHGFVKVPTMEKHKFTRVL